MDLNQVFDPFFASDAKFGNFGMNQVRSKSHNELANTGVAAGHIAIFWKDRIHDISIK